MAGNYPPVRPPQQNFYAMPGGYPQQGPWAQGNSQYYTNSPIPPEGGYGMPTQIAGGHKYMPPRQDVNAPDLYIPFMAVFTYCVLSCVAKVGTGTFTPATMMDMAQAAIVAWVIHSFAIKVLLYLLGISSAQPIAETIAYGGYPFVSVCVATIARLAAPFVGVWPYRVITGYASMMLAVFMVRSMKRVIFQEARGSRIDSSRHNYVLLVLGLLEFPFVFWLSAVRL